MKRLVLLIAVVAGLVTSVAWLRPAKAMAAKPLCTQKNSDGKWVAVDCPLFIGNDVCAELTGKGNATVVPIDCAKYYTLTGISPPGCSASDPNCASTLNGNAVDTKCPNGSGGTIKIATPGLSLNCTIGKDGKPLNPIYALVQFIINWAIRLLGVLAVLAIVISGIQYIVSQGSPDGLKTAKSRLSHAVIGLILLSLMFVILRLIGIAS